MNNVTDWQGLGNSLKPQVVFNLHIHVVKIANRKLMRKKVLSMESLKFMILTPSYTRWTVLVLSPLTETHKGLH